MKDNRPLSFRNIDSRLQGFDSARIHANDWQNIVEYVHGLESSLTQLVQYSESTLSHDVHGGYTHCFFCKGVKFNGQEVEHKPDCPLIVARERIEGER